MLQSCVGFVHSWMRSATLLAALGPYAVQQLQAQVQNWVCSQLMAPLPRQWLVRLAAGAASPVPPSFPLSGVCNGVLVCADLWQLVPRLSQCLTLRLKQ